MCSFFLYTVSRENKCEITINSINTKVNIERTVELGICVNKTSEVFTAKNASCFSSKFTNRNKSFVFKKYYRNFF